MIGDRVGYFDYLGVPHTGTVAYIKPHNTEEGIYWLGIVRDIPECNTIEIETENGTMLVAAYIRSDEVYPLID